MDSYLLQPSIKSLGHSGCEVKLINKGDYRVNKKSSDRSYNARFRAQINKQIDFADDHLHCPTVFNIWDDDGLLVAEMEYINAADFACYIEVKPVDDVLWLIHKLCDYLKTRVGRYPVAPTPEGIIRTKLTSTAESIRQNPIVAHLARYVPEYEPLVPMPMGSCHGDLTFSNILVTRDNSIYVIDFLDSFVESPLIDIVKLRQDTRHYWSIGRNHGEFDRTKIELVFDRFDRIICETFGGESWWANYSFFQRLNLCRILPYVKDPTDAAFIEVELNRV